MKSTFQSPMTNEYDSEVRKSDGKGLYSGAKCRGL